jgi:hypothetical protein
MSTLVELFPSGEATSLAMYAARNATDRTPESSSCLPKRPAKPSVAGASRAAPATSRRGSGSPIVNARMRAARQHVDVADEQIQRQLDLPTRHPCRVAHHKAAGHGVTRRDHQPLRLTGLLSDDRGVDRVSQRSCAVGVLPGGTER